MMLPGLVTPWDPLHNDGYQFWSGIGSGSPVLVALAMFWRKHNCHEHGCWKWTWHPDKDGHPVCKVHHDDHPSRGWFRSDRQHPRHRRSQRAS
jgi:hypothetical protein